MKTRIRDLERQLSQATGNTNNASAQNAPASVANAGRGLLEASQDRIENGLFGAPRMFGRTVLHKSRQFGQSHWINGVSVVSICILCLASLVPSVAYIPLSF